MEDKETNSKLHSFRVLLRKIKRKNIWNTRPHIVAIFSEQINSGDVSCLPQLYFEIQQNLPYFFNPYTPKQDDDITWTQEVTRYERE